MLVLVIVISIGIIAIEKIQNRANKISTNIGGSFLLTDQNNARFNSQSIDKK